MTTVAAPQQARAGGTTGTHQPRAKARAANPPTTASPASNAAERLAGERTRIPSNAPDKQLAWSLIKELSSVESTIRAAVNGNGPVRMSAYDDPRVTARQSEQFRNYLELLFAASRGKPGRKPARPRPERRAAREYA